MNAGRSVSVDETEPTRDYLAILSGASQNVVGIAAAAAFMLAVQVLMTRTLGREGFGVVTLLTQAAFVASFATRTGMDMAVLRDVAVDAGIRRWDRARGTVTRAVAIAAVVSAVVAVVVAAAGDPLRTLLRIDPRGTDWVVQAAAVGVPFIAIASVWLAATRALKIMRYTLYVFWLGQNAAWIALTLVLWQWSTTATASILSYSLSWAAAAAAAWFFWRRESASWEVSAPEPGWLARLMRYAGPRAPAALFAQLLFWTDLFVLTQFATRQGVGVYSAVLRAGQVVMLFLTSVNWMFAPFVADLYNRGQTRRLDDLYKTLTRWIVAATLPLFLLISVAPGAVMNVFGAEFSEGRAALLIVLAGQFVNIITGSAGFILVMVGRTGWDLLIYVGSVVLDVALALWLCPRYGIEGAAIANAVTFAASNCVRLLAVKKFVGIAPYDSRYLRLVVPAVAGGAAMWIVHAAIEAGYVVDLVATAVVGGLAYVVAYLAVGLTAAERRGMSGLIARVRAR